MYVKKQPLDHPSQLDKLKNLREGEAEKKGLLLKNSRLKETTLKMDRELKDNPCSIYISEKWPDKKVDPFARSNSPQNAMSQYNFDACQNPEIITKSSVYKPLRTNIFDKK